MAKNNALLVALNKALPDSVKKGLPENIKAMLAQLSDGDAPQADLVDYVEDQEADQQLEDLCIALADALDDVLDSETVEDKREAVTALLEQFQEALGAGGLLKAGRKISSSNLGILNQIQELLAQLIAGATGDAPEDGEDDPEEGEEEGAPEEVAMARKAAKEQRAAAKAEREKKRKEKEAKAMKKSADQVAIEKKMAGLEADLKKERDIRLDAEFLQKAKDIGPVPGTTFEKSAALLKSLNETNPEMAKQVEEQMRASAEIARKSALFSEIGKGAGGGGSDSAASVFVSKAQDIAKRDNIKLADAMTKASKEDPTAYAEYVNSQRKGA